MKKLLSTFVVLFFFQSYTSAQNNIEIVNFKILSQISIIEKSGISFNFDIEMPVIENYNSNPFYFYFTLTDLSETVVFQNENLFLKIYSQPYFKDKTKSISKAELFFIPYSEINVPSGKSNLTLKCIVKNSDTDSYEVFQKQIEIIKPTLYNYDEQTFTISDFTITDNVYLHEQKGLEVNFNSTFEFCSYQINGIYKDKNLTDYVFYLKFYNAPTLEEYLFFSDYFSTYSQTVENLTENINFFIPYNKLNINEGLYNIKAELYARDNNSTINFGKISEINFQYYQPKLYLAKFCLYELLASYNHYDTQSTFGQIFSNTKSNKGKGYPDIFWEIKIGDLSEFESAINKNSFYTKSDSSLFIVTDDDPLYLTVYDYDALNRNDEIAKFKIEHKYKYNSLFFKDAEIENVDSYNFKFSKSEMPYFDFQNLNIAETIENQVSGLNISLNCKLNSIPVDEKVKIIPYIMRDTNLIDLISINNRFGNVDFLTSADNQKSIEFFMPYYYLSENDKLGFKFIFDNFKFQLPDLIYSENLEIPEIKDITFKINSITEDYYQNVYGLNLNCFYNIPEDYKNDIGTKNLVYNNIILNTSTNDTLVSIDLNSVETEIENEKNIFIPYYQFKNLSEKQDIEMYSLISSKSGRIYGETKKSFIVNPSEIVNLNIEELNFKISESEIFESYIIKIEHFGKLIYKSENVSLTNSDRLLINKDYWFHSNDKIFIEIYGIDKFNLETLISSKEQNIKELIKSSKIKLKGNSNFKKVSLKFKFVE